MIRPLIAAAFAFCVTVLPAWGEGQSATDRFRECRSGTGQKAIDACTWYLSGNSGYNTSTDNRVFTLGLRGEAYLSLDNYQAAFDDFSSALALHPHDAIILGLHAYAARRLKQYDAAIADYDTMLASDPNDANAYNGRCFARTMANRDLELALADCNKGLVLHNTPEALDSRALVYFRMGQYKQAVADYDAALAANPKLVPSLYVRGLAELKLGDAAAGNADIASAKALDPSVADAYAAYGVTP